MDLSHASHASNKRLPAALGVDSQREAFNDSKVTGMSDSDSDHESSVHASDPASEAESCRSELS